MTGHPIEAPARASRVATLLPIAVVVLTAAMILWSAWPTLRPTRSVSDAQVVFDRSMKDVQPSERPSGTSVLAPGWLEAEPFYVACTALADGIVESIDVLEGDQVSEGQIVARLVSEDAELSLAQAQARLESARADLALARAETIAATTEWDESVERLRALEASQGAVLEIEAELARWPSLVAAAQAKHERLREEVVWAEESLEGGAVTELEVFVARRDSDAQQATLEAIKAQGPLLEARLMQQKAHLRAAQRHLDLRIEERLRLDTARATEARAEANVRNAVATRDVAALELERMVIRAPIDGFVQRRWKVPGDKVMRGMDSEHSAHLVHLYDPSRIQVRVDVALADAANIFVGQRCDVVVEVLPDQTFEGVVLRSTHEADLQKNTLQFKVGVVDPSPLLRPEMLTRVKFLPQGSARGDDPNEAATTRVLVPAEAVDDHTGSTRVWTVTSRRGTRGIVRPVQIDVRSSVDGWATVSGPLNPGQLIVMNGNDLADGQRVRVTRHKGGA